MMYRIEQYNGLFSLYLYMIVLLPVIVLSLFGKRCKILNLLTSVLLVVMILGPGSLQMWECVLFLSYELGLLYTYIYLHGKKKSRIWYRMIFIFSMIPLITTKMFERTELATYVDIGFLGISYMCFKLWQLLIEIHDDRLKQFSLTDIIGFLLFAPSFSSGPIDRFKEYKEGEESVYTGGDYFKDYLIPGLSKVTKGLFYKFVPAFLISRYFMEYHLGGGWVDTVAYMYGYTLHIFFDFAGYSLMAIGTGMVMGHRLPENFNKPFLARNIKEFWERWHMSLSAWLNEYLFSRFALTCIREGWIRNPRMAKYMSYMVTMSIMGIWHGFYIHYILYGIYHGGMLIITDVWLSSSAYRFVKKMKYYNIVSRAITFQIVAFGMLIFSGYIINV